MPSMSYSERGSIQMRLARRVAGGALCGMLALAGCTSVIYDSNPQAPAEALAEEPDFASQTVQNLLATSLRWVVEHYPPPPGENREWFAINLPPGLTREQYIEVARQVGERAAPLTPELEYLPTYHIGWVWMRGDHARVDVVRPVFSLSTGGDTVYQTITLHLSRRYASWRVDRTQPWEPGVVPLPPRVYLPELPPEELPPEEQVPEPAEEAPEAEASAPSPRAATTVVLPETVEDDGAAPDGPDDPIP